MQRTYSTLQIKVHFVDALQDSASILQQFIQGVLSYGEFISLHSCPCMPTRSVKQVRSTGTPQVTALSEFVPAPALHACMHSLHREN